MQVKWFFPYRCGSQMEGFGIDAFRMLQKPLPAVEEAIMNANKKTASRRGL